MQIDPFAQTFGLPKCFVTPIASKSIEGIEKYVGKTYPIEKYPNDAFIVNFQKYEKSNEFDVWNQPRSFYINNEKQLWVHVDFKKYRSVYESVFPEIDLTKKIHIDHLMNRRQARLFDFKFIRLLHVDNVTNTISGLNVEKKAIDMHGDIEGLKELDKHQQIEYADVFVLTKILNFKTGGEPFFDVADLNPIFYNGELMINYRRNELINLLKHIYGFDRFNILPFLRKYTQKQLSDYKEKITEIEKEIARLNVELKKGNLNNQVYYRYLLNFRKD